MVAWGPVLGFVAAQILGVVWYHPSVFGKRWMSIVHSGKSPKDLSTTSGPAILVTMVAHAALAGFLHHIFLDHMGVNDMSTSLRAGLAMSGIGALSEVCHMMFGHKSLTLFAIDQGFNFAVVFLISAGIGYFL